MTKKELVAKVATETGLSQTDVRKVLDSTLESIKGAVRSGEEVKLSDFGNFKKTTRAERNGINPSTKESIKIAAKDVAKFKASSNFLN